MALYLKIKTSKRNKTIAFKTKYVLYRQSDFLLYILYKIITSVNFKSTYK